jgi:DNA-binding transcriptional regulator YdaS (Cro superfamily)
MNIEDVVQELGGCAVLARQIGVSTQAVWNWVYANKKIPPQRAIQIEALTNGKYKAAELVNAKDAGSKS